jgi:hypothetical protein
MKQCRYWLKTNNTDISIITDITWQSMSRLCGVYLPENSVSAQYKDKILTDCLDKLKDTNRIKDVHDDYTLRTLKRFLDNNIPYFQTQSQQMILGIPVKTRAELNKSEKPKTIKAVKISTSTEIKEYEKVPEELISRFPIRFKPQKSENEKADIDNVWPFLVLLVKKLKELDPFLQVLP